MRLNYPMRSLEMKCLLKTKLWWTKRLLQQIISVGTMTPRAAGSQQLLTTLESRGNMR